MNVLNIVSVTVFKSNSVSVMRIINNDPIIQLRNINSHLLRSYGKILL